MKRILLFIFLVLLAAGGYFAYLFFRPAVRLPDPGKPYLYISTGENFSELQKDLEENYIKGKGFSLVSKILKFRNPRPGRYKLKKGMSVFALVRMLRNGQHSPVKMVIIKERTIQAFAGKFGRGKKFDSETDSLAMIQFLTNMDSLKQFGLDTNTVMAAIMPYTYETRWNSSPSKIFRQFYSSYNKFWNTDRKTKADSLHLSPVQVITLASIVEEETNRKDDKYMIASTYLNRINKGMKLQADPTVKFALKNFALKRITGVHTGTDSPYNTYVYPGLPPGPICTPSVETIEAVLDAPETDYLYFVASDKFDGSSVFTSNFSDHQKYAKLYQAELTRRMDSARKVNAK